jgi:large subunit ribosomal protein L9
MPSHVKLLLVDNVDSLGIVGDVVNVRIGYARNFLLPRGLAETPSPEKVKSLAAKRAQAEQDLANQRSVREQMIQKMAGLEIELVRPCNDMGILYGAITQQEVATLLGAKGFAVKAREVRIPATIKRVDTYDIHVKLDRDLDATVKLKVKPDRELTAERGTADEENEKKPVDEKRAMTREERREAREDKFEEKRDARRQARANAMDQLIADDAAKKATKGTWGAGKPAAAIPTAPGADAAAPGAAGEAKADGDKTKKEKSDKSDKADKAGKGEKKAKK